MVILYIINGLLFLSGFFTFFLKEPEKRFSRALVQALLVVVLLAAEYVFLAYYRTECLVRLVLVSEILLSFTWFFMAFYLRHAIAVNTEKRVTRIRTSQVAGSVITVVACLVVYRYSVFEQFAGEIVFPTYGFVYLIAVINLAAVLYISWRLEQFWRRLNAAQRWEYKFFIIGAYIVCGSIAWFMSYRLTYLAIAAKHLHLLAILLLSGAISMFYAIVQHRLLNRKIFVSRKVIYSFVVPSFLAAYLLGFGIVTLVMRTFGLEMTFVLKWLFLILGSVGVTAFGFSGKIRSRIHFFISTHFYINKYEYRDEWLALSRQLQGALTEIEVVQALRRVLSTSLYTTQIFIWLGDETKGYRLISSPENSVEMDESFLKGDDPLVNYFSTCPYFHRLEKNRDSLWRNVMDAKEQFFSSLNLTLIVPISIGNQVPGLIGLGPEYTGGHYGYDDFDLLIALGCQTASAILAVRMAEQLAGARESQAWDRLSAFVLHDIKNAATMLSLLQENAKEHIHELEFQQDMLESVDDALKRMARVEERLGALKDEIDLILEDIDFESFLLAISKKLKSKLVKMNLTIDVREKVNIISDRNLLASIFENLLLNAFQAKEEDLEVLIVVTIENDTAVIVVSDNGPGIPEELLPDSLFEPFKTSKKGGTGIGLWQVKKKVEKLKGTITAGNRIKGGAIFILKLPLS